MSLSRRAFLGLLPALAAAERGRVRITDIRVMVLQGPRTYTLVKVVTDAGVSGIGEGYGSPGVGIKEGVLELRPYFIGKDPLQIEALYNGLTTRVDGSAHMLLRAVSAIEIALWDLAGKLLGQPVSALLGGRYRERVRVYCDDGPANMLDRTSCNEWADHMKSDPAGWTAFKIPPPRSTPKLDNARDPANRVLTSREIRDIRQAFEYCRDAIGWDHDLIVHCHWEYDLRTAIQLAEAVEPIKPLWLEDPMPPDFSESWVRLAEVSKVPIGTGENLARRQGFKDYLTRQACDIAQLDIRNTGGLLESKKIADLAELYSVPMAAHNTGSVVNTMATIQWAAAVRDFLAAETLIGRRNWMDDVIVHDGPVVVQGYIAVPQKPGLGIELNPDVVKANLASGKNIGSEPVVFPSLTIAYVAPFGLFIALLAIRRWVPLEPETWAALRFVLIAAALVVFSRRVIPWPPSSWIGSILLGAVVFFLWIAADVLWPGYRDFWLFRNAVTGAAASSLDVRLKTNIFFITLRVLESAILIPILEELFWRGWLMRWLIRPQFQSVPLGQYTPAAFWIVALLFASEHGSYWEVGLLAGIAYNAWIVRTRNLANCILAHAITNLMLAAYVLLFDKWQYWL